MSTGMMGHVHAQCRISAHSHMQQRFTHLQSLKGWKPARGQAARCRTFYCAAQSASTQQSREAIVLVDHGSKRAEANAMLEQFAEVYRCDCTAESVFKTLQRRQPAVNTSSLPVGAVQGDIRAAACQDSAHGAGSAVDCGRYRRMRRGGRGQSHRRAVLPVQVRTLDRQCQ